MKLPRNLLLLPSTLPLLPPTLPLLVLLLPLLTTGAGALLRQPSPCSGAGG